MILYADSSTVKDYLVLLSAFHTIQCQRDFPKIAEQGAMQYQIWAQMMLPYYQQRRVERSKGIQARYQRSTGGLYMHRIDTQVDRVGSDEPILGGTITSSPTLYDDMDAWPRARPRSQDANGDGVEDDNVSDTSTDERPAARPGRASTGVTENTDITHHSTMTDTDATLIDEVQEDGIQFLPPLPVLMAWHAHVLHSAKYEKEVDTNGAYSALRDYPFPLREAVSLHPPILSLMLRMC